MMQKIPLRDLDAHLLKWLEPGRSKRVTDLADADGVMFACPKCFVENGGLVGTHMVLCWFAGKVPAAENPSPGRWHPSGEGLDDLTFVGPGATSVLLNGGCGWHGFVEGGKAG